MDRPLGSRNLADVPMAGVVLRIAQNMEAFTVLHADEFTPDANAERVWGAIEARRYAERGITDPTLIEPALIEGNRS